jgi:hypothetical protein
MIRRSRFNIGRGLVLKDPRATRCNAASCDRSFATGAVGSGGYTGMATTPEGQTYVARHVIQRISKSGLSSRKTIYEVASRGRETRQRV